MKFLIAPDSFKGSLTAVEAAHAIHQGLRAAWPTATFDLLPMADGGEGTVRALVAANQGSLVTTTTTGPLGSPVQSAYGLINHRQTAVIEVAAASGLGLMQGHLNPLTATSRGTGEQIIAALDHGAKTIIIGLGGSATNDGGAGLLQALGVHLLDRHHHELAPGGGQLDQLACIDARHIDPRIADTHFIVASDVTNPLTGPNGASTVFGPQKGANREMVRQLDHNLRHFGQLVEQVVARPVSTLAGSGAAGGIGMALLAFTPATMRAGVEIVLEATHFKQRVKTADIVITGEGRLDAQTQYGKTPFGVAKAAKSTVPACTVIALTGNVAEDIGNLYDQIDAIFPIVAGADSLAHAIQVAGPNLTRTAANLGRLIKQLTAKK